jgi:hypothetical protein
VRAQLRIDHLVAWRREVRREHDLAAAADAVPERTEAVGCGRAVASEAATLALGCGLRALAQRAFKVPSLCSRAFEVFCAAGSALPALEPGACA